MIHHTWFLHRDLKPDNILIGSNDDELSKLYVIDFGLAMRYYNPTKKTFVPYKDNKNMVGRHDMQVLQPI